MSKDSKVALVTGGNRGIGYEKDMGGLLMFLRNMGR
ncbi:hypothetical protein GGC63_001689 [Paenibacillus sp. OAS669]|nr:hypothetical protein [Paenibacillus sp. OAS669]